MAVLREAYDAAVAFGALDRAATHATRLVALLGARGDADHLRETLLFIQEAREALGAALPARFHFAAGDSLERQGQTAQALLLYEGLTGHPESAIARRAAVRHARLLLSTSSPSAAPAPPATRWATPSPTRNAWMRARNYQ